MKKVLMICFLIAGTALYAQPPGHVEKGPHHEKRDFIHELSPQQRAELKTKRMVLDLNLSQVQRAEVLKLNLEIATAREKNKPDPNNEEKPTSEEIFKESSAKLDEMIATKRKLQKILTKEQFEKFERSHNRKEREHKHVIGRKKR